MFFDIFFKYKTLNKQIQFKMQTELLKRKNTIFRDKNYCETEKRKLSIDKNITVFSDNAIENMNY